MLGGVKTLAANRADGVDLAGPRPLIFENVEHGTNAAKSLIHNVKICSNAWNKLEHHRNRIETTRSGVLLGGEMVWGLAKTIMYSL